MPRKSRTTKRDVDMHTYLRTVPMSQWDGEWPYISPYAMLRDNWLFSNDRSDREMDKMLRVNAEHLLEKGTQELRVGALAGNAEDMLELATRACSGVTVPKNDEEALEYLNQIVRPETHAPRPLRARAWALIAHIHFERRFVENRPESWNIDSMYRGASAAAECAALGFVPPGVLAIGMTIERHGIRRQADCTFIGLDVTRFTALTDLWRVVDRRKVEILREQRKRNEKVKRDPTAYVCAAEGCGVEATHKAGLAKCGGKCAREGKPAYCSKECQKKDWPRHKPFCREGAPIDELAASKRQIAVEDTMSLNPDSLNLAHDNSKGPGAGVHMELHRIDGTKEKDITRKDEHIVYVPSSFGGPPMKVTTSSLDAGELKEFKTGVEGRVARKGVQDVW